VNANEMLSPLLQTWTDEARKEQHHSIPPQPPRSYALRCLDKKVILTQFLDHQSSLVEHYMSEQTTITVPHILTSLGIIWDHPANWNIVDCSVLPSTCSMATLGHAMPMLQLRYFLTFILEHLPHPPTHLNLFFVTVVSLSHSRKLLVDRL
jgi:hypothetical protein